MSINNYHIDLSELSEAEERGEAEAIVSKLLSSDVVEALDILSNLDKGNTLPEKLMNNHEEFDSLLNSVASLIRADENMMNRLITNAMVIYKEEIEEAYQCR